MPDIQHDGVSIHFEEHGSGPPILLAHSFLCSTAMWDPIVPALAEGHRVINVDLRGHGRSGPAVPPIDLRDLLGDHLAVLDELGIERAVWAGLSIGGMIALRAALDHPERVSALALFDTDAGPERFVTTVRYRLMGLASRLFGLRPLGPQVERLMFGASTLANRPELTAEWRERFTGVHVPSILAILGGLVTRDSLLPRLGEIEHPTLVLVGAEDRALPVPRSRAIADRIPGADLRIVPAAGHLSVLEQPDAATELLLPWLAEAVGAGA